MPTTTFTDPAQQAAHAAKSARFVLDTDALDVRTRGADGTLYSLVAQSRRDVETPRDLVDLLRSWKGVGMSDVTADDMIGVLYEEYTAELEGY